ncbi:4'-phosphopantetheinyl transferase family protein [Paenibacillus turpanensis]|uniref:4'-phosphopantetheinyl transferase family protein n=1 Tax=Paenibacillus turpanensis TaxID=2689078 RepID=UPI00140A69D9|nr:4'-phosphopantetheinyl transferase superfamily protein [Paenibacillus turpanensis]
MKALSQQESVLSLIQLRNTPGEASILDQAFAYLPPSKQQKLRRYRVKQSYYQSLVGEVAVRVYAILSLKIANDKLKFRANEYGKPMLVNDERFQFNISHSGEWVACVVGLGSGAAGVDIEAVKPLDLSIAESFCSPQEMACLQTLTSSKEQLSYLYDLWTLKESFIKADGRGLSLPIQLIEFQLSREEICCHFNGEVQNNRRFRRYPFSTNGTDFILSLCCTTSFLPREITRFAAEEVAEHFIELAEGSKIPDKSSTAIPTYFS